MLSVLMVSVALNDYQLKGRSEKVYWPRIKEIMERKGVPSSPEDIRRNLTEFYRHERLSERKIRRLNRFLSSDLAEKLWKASPDEVAKDFSQIWLNLSEVMEQNPHDKTIAFAMKALGIALLMVGRRDFSFESILPLAALALFLSHFHKKYIKIYKNKTMA